MTNVMQEVLNVKRRMYTPNEVALHNCAEDVWLAVFGKVYDLTTFVRENEGPLVAPMIEKAGSDVTEWFDHLTGDVKYHTDPDTNLKVPFTPMGRFMHVPPKDPTSDWKNDFGTPWWRDQKYLIGSLSKSTRLVRIVNVLSKQEKLLEVCAEETLKEVLDRYLAWNNHADSYTWKGLIEGAFVPLDMQKTLEENNVPDEASEFERLSIEEEFYFPILHLYFNDDLTVA